MKIFTTVNLTLKGNFNFIFAFVEVERKKEKYLKEIRISRSLYKNLLIVFQKKKKKKQS